MSEEKLNYKIVIPDVDTLTSGPDDLDLAPLDQFGRVVAVDTADQDKVKEELKDADAILVNKIEINEELLGSNPSVKFVGLFATGYNNVDLEYCNAHGITVCNVPTYSTNAVAQQTFAFILEHYTNLSKYNGFVQEGGWVNSGTFAPFVFPLSELSSKTIGLIGYGKIGHQVAKIARAFGMDVLVYTRNYEQAKSAGDNTALEGFLDRADRDVTFVTLDNLLRHSDIVSVHCPLNEQSKGLINSETISKMRDGAFFVNTSRGPIVNEQDLRNALDSGKLSGAGVDVVSIEPMAADCPLLGAPNCIITPHVAWCPMETRRRLLSEVIKNYKAFLDGKPVNTVTK